MFHHGSQSSGPPSHLRRRYQAWKDDQRNSGRLSGDGTDGLELSIHMPSRPYGNRFEVLRPASPPPKATRNPTEYSRYRRGRHGHGSREAKRRRDARRNHTKLQAIHALDDQLSREFERTLSQANVQRQQGLNEPNPTPALPATTYAAPKPARVPATPPQLPYFNFGGLDLYDECTQPGRMDSGYSTPTPPTPSISGWRPELPPFAGGNIKWTNFPLFFDLSKLPEPALPAVETKGRELQLWRPQPSPHPKKQSRFFPPASPAKPNVKLPPTSCTLHADNKGPVDVAPVKPKTVAESLELAVNAAEAARKARSDDQAEKSAANLWNILTSSEHTVRGDDNDLYTSNTSYNSLDSMDVPPLGLFDHRLESIGAPCELDDTSVPYVHANSLTGHANERGSESFSISEEDVTLFDPPANPAHVQELLGGLNELVMDPYTDEGYTDALLAVLTALPLPSPEEEQELEDTAPIVTDPPSYASIIRGRAQRKEESKTELETSDAHFKSEQALFTPPPIPPAKPAEEDLVDVATFLRMGHSDNCWCNDCGEPELLNPWDLTPKESEPEVSEWGTEDEGWMFYSTDEEVSRSPSVSSAWEWEWGTIVVDEETKVKVEDLRAPAEVGSTKAPTWDETFPCKPSCVAHRPW